MAKKFSFKIALFFIGNAVYFSTNLVFARERSVSLGEVAGNIYGNASILMRVMWAACIIVGIVLIITAFTQFQTHKKNPKLVTLGQPVTYFILGLIALGIPFAERILNLEDANTEEEQVDTEYIDLDKKL